MKIFKILLSIIVLGTGAIGMVGCSSSESTTPPTQTTTVTRGDLTLDITAAGNLALSTIEDLTFDLFYAKGTVGEVMVSEGDAVTEGQVLASLDTSEWNDQIQTLEDAVTTAQRTATTKERTLATAQRQVTTLTRQITAKEDAVVTAQRQVTSKELAVTQAQLNVTSANIKLNKIKLIKNIQVIIDNLNFVIKTATALASGEFAGA